MEDPGWKRLTPHPGARIMRVPQRQGLKVLPLCFCQAGH